MSTVVAPRVVVILDPTVQAEVREGVLAPRAVDRGRPTSLDGRRVGLLDNVKTNADVFLDRVEAHLRERWAGAEFVRRTKPQAGEACPPAMFEALAGCDVVINAFGD